MIDISLETHPELYRDYASALKYLSNLNMASFDYPSHIVNFHVYSEIRNVKELACVESYLATQNLTQTKLILWSDYSIEDNPLIQPYKHLIDMRVYDPIEEAKGTALENNLTWLTVQDTKHYMKSGILRFLVTHKYGGVWIDMDAILLRDFKPILDQEWAYMWGAELDFYNFGPCAALMNINQNSEHSNLCINEILKTRVIPDSTVLDHMLLAKVYSKRRFTVFPSVFMNTEWQMNTIYIDGVKHYDPKGLGTTIESGWFKCNEYSSNLFLEAFAWHWHNSTYKNNIIEPNSKFDLLMRRNKQLLYDRGII